MPASQGGAQLTTLKGSELALGVQFSAAIGKDKSLTLTTGLPLEMDYKGMNEIVDKVAAVIDRQGMKYKLEDKLDLISQAKDNLIRNRAQADTYRTNAEIEWFKTGRKGAFQMRGQQEKELQNYANTDKHLTEVIKKLEEDADELRKQIDAS